MFAVDVGVISLLHYPFRRSTVLRGRISHPTIHRASRTSQSQMLMLIPVLGYQYAPLGSAAYAIQLPLASKLSWGMLMARNIGQKQKPTMLLRSKKMKLNKLQMIRKLVEHQRWNLHKHK